MLETEGLSLDQSEDSSWDPSATLLWLHKAAPPTLLSVDPDGPPLVLEHTSYSYKASPQQFYKFTPDFLGSVSSEALVNLLTISILNNVGSKHLKKFNN